MKATDLLKAQHKAVEKLFAAIEKSEDDAEEAQLFAELASNLVAHDGIEREIFYPACEAQMGMTDQLGEALVEHGVVEFCLYEANNALGDETFDFKVRVLREMVEHHVEEEEGEFFPAVEKDFDEELLEALGAKMKAGFEKNLAKDFREPLFANLQQVLAGTIKPRKVPEKKNGAKKPHQRASASR